MICIRGRLYEIQENYDLVLVDYTSALQFAPRNANYLNARSVLYRKVGNYPAAVSDLTQSIAAVNSASEPYNLRGMIYMLHFGDIKCAMADFKTCVARDFKSLLDCSTWPWDRSKSLEYYKKVSHAAYVTKLHEIAKKK